MEINPTILLLAKNPKEARIKQLKLEKMRTAALQQSSKPPNAATPVREKNLPQNKPSNRKYQTKKQATTLGNKPVPKPNSKPGTTRATRSMSRSSSQTEPPCDNTPQNLPSRSQEQNIVEQTSTQNTNTSPQSETPTQDPTPNPNPNPQPIHSHIPSPQPNTSGRTGLTSPLSLMSILRHMATTSPTPMDDNILDREENPLAGPSRQTGFLPEGPRVPPNVETPTIPYSQILTADSDQDLQCQPASNPSPSEATVTAQLRTKVPQNAKTM